MPFAAAARRAALRAAAACLWAGVIHRILLKHGWFVGLGVLADVVLVDVCAGDATTNTAATKNASIHDRTKILLDDMGVNLSISQ